MNELELIVQRMIDAGEPEENIASVIKEYESRESGKITPPQEDNQGVPAEVNATPELKSTELPLVDTSLELQGDKKDKEIQQEISKNFVSSFTGLPKSVIPSVSSIASGVLNTAAGLGDFVEKYGMAPIAALLKTGGTANINPGYALSEYEKIAKNNNLDLSAITDAADLISNLSTKKFDEEGREKDIYGLIEEGNYVDAADLAVNQALGSAPSLALSIASPIYGSALLGMSTAGGEFEKELKERPEESISKIASGSLLKGGIETATEFAGGYFAKTLGALNKTGITNKVMKDFTSNFLEKSLKTLGAGIGGSVSEGLTEGVTAIGQTFIDDKLYEDEIEGAAYIRNFLNGAIVGAVMGGPVTGTGRGISFSNIDKNKAYQFIAPKNWRLKNNEIQRNIIEAKINLQVAPSNKKKKFQEQINVLELQKENRLKELNTAFDGLTKKEILKFTDNISIIADATGEINNARYTKSQQNFAKQQLQNAANENETLVGKEMFDADIEKNISKTLKNTERINEAFVKAKQKVKNVKFEYLSDPKAEFDASFDPNTNTVIVNSPKALETEQTNAIGHELLHYMMAQKFATDNASMQPLVDSFKDYLKETQPEVYQRVQERIDLNYTDEAGNIERGALEEYFNVFSDLVAKEKIIVNESLSDKIKNTTTRFLNGLGFGSVKLETGKDVFNFIRNYQKNISEFKFKQLGVDLKSSKIPQAVKQEIQQSKKSISGDNIQKIFDEKGKDGAFDIIEAYKPLTKRITNKYRDVPGFDFELLQSEIEIGKRGLLDLINAYDTSKGATLNTYIQGQLERRAIEAANRILDTEFKLDVTEAKAVTDTSTEESIEAQEQVEIADEIKSLRKEIGLSEELVTTVKDAVIKTFGTKLPNPQDPKFRLELQKRFRTELKKPLAKFVGKQADYESFLRDNFQSIYNKLPQSLINRRFKDFQEPVLDKNGKHVREKTAEGNKVYTKKKITPAEWIKYFLGTDVGRSTQGTRKTAVVEAVAEEIAFDATMEVLQSPDVINKYQDIAGITGEVLPENFKAVIAKQIDRSENFKFSKSLANQAEVKYSLSSQELASILFEKNMIELANDFPDIADSINNESFKKSYPKVFFDIVVPAFDKAVNTAIDNNDTILAEDIVFHFIKIFSRGTRSVSSKKGELKLTTNKALWENVIYPTIKGTGLSSKKKFNLLKSGQRSYIRYGDMAIGTLIDVTSNSVRNQIMSGEITKAEVNNQNAEARDALQNIVFNIGKKHPGLAASIIKLNQKDQRTIFRGAATLNRIVQNYSGETVYEHNPPVQFVFNEIIDYFKNPSDSKKNDLKNLFNTMEANLVPKDFAEIVDEKYKDKMPPKGIFRYSDALSKTDYTFDEGEFKYSKSLSKDFNKFLEASTGIDFAKEYSADKASIIGKGKGKYKFFVPYSAEDFVGLLYTTLAKSKKGDEQMQFYKDNLLTPFAKAIRQFETDKQMSMNAWANLKKQINNTPAKLGKTNETGYTNEQAVRLYIWNRQDTLPEGSSKQDVNEVIKFINKNENLKNFAEQLISLAPPGEYANPSGNWLEGTITTDMLSYVNQVKRSEYMQEWKDNVEEIFGEFKQGKLEGPNINKLKALYGDQYVESLTDILYRMKDGRNRRAGGNKIERAWLEWVNGSVGSIMFLNARSALLQTISAVNFINFTDNNPIMAAKAFANQSQFWNDFGFLFNSDFLKQRRAGLKTDVNADEIASAAKTADNKVRAAFNAILKFGFLPTQMADSFAIAIGGASFYRNRLNKYVKDGMSQEAAQEQAFLDFTETAEESQQSSRPDRISMQQASSLGRVILAFANTPMQYARLTKKAMQDLAAGRGDWKTNISKLMYYSVIQNVVFSALQQALFALLFSDEEDDKEKERLWNIGNGSLDTLLRGTGLYGAIASTSKNVILEIIKQNKAKRTDYTKAVMKATSLSPPINSKLNKLNSAAKAFTYRQDKEKMRTEGFSLDNPAFLAGGRIVSALTNLPADRAIIKADHIKTAMESETELWQSIALTLGYSEWDLGMIEKQTKKPSSKFKKFKKFEKFKKFK